MRIVPVPCLADNYAYLLICERTGITAVVDPSESEPVVAALERERLTPTALLCTHHHPDHVGGVAALVSVHPNLKVYGHESEHARIPHLNKPLSNGAQFAVGSINVSARHVPGHTTGALGFVVDDAAVFTGDTLFVAGCGRLFEGTAAMMLQSLTSGFASLPGATLVYPGHEYAEKNLRFACMVEPDNSATRTKHERVMEARRVGQPCVPSTIADERATNPFLRTDSAAVVAFARSHAASSDDGADVFSAVRRARDGF